MNTLLVANFLGWLLIGLGAVQLVPLAAALWFGEPILPYAASAVTAFVFGLSVVLGTKPENRRLRAREGFLTVGVAWVLASLLGSIP
ncbi:MAG: TrkH family potassium uptake protein, partial [Deltaproteobacteria bacterium]|nr:TrkH family potassium uptake protein [Deltaproteobacteria bacterium]